MKAINYEDNDDVKNIPFSFMLFDVLRKRCNDDYEFLEKQFTLGLDPVAYLGLRPAWEFNESFHKKIFKLNNRLSEHYSQHSV